MIQLEGGIITLQFPLRMGPLRAGMAAQRGEPAHRGTDTAIRGKLDPEHVPQQAGGRRAQG